MPIIIGMNSIGTMISHARKKRRLTQQEAASRSKLSRAAFQNIEHNLANPSLSSLTHALSSVGLTISIQPDIDWGRLIKLGLPLALKSECPVEPSEDILIAALHEAVYWYLESPVSGFHPREIDALESLVLALSIGWPSAFRRCALEVPSLHRLLPTTVNGRHIKLYRLARSRLSTYL
ncbi:MAG: helix-turn-helix transcriptional regulator [Deltaproteobacteria bacterium]|nr:helix-turn-helix transcriptional regulator [Deltaproteobacteria bacterium]MBN2671300.1 helix-turn-helix transcriptional regulator [Deltaproteobacteria bacterium]